MYGLVHSFSKFFNLLNIWLKKKLYYFNNIPKIKSKRDDYKKYIAMPMIGVWPVGLWNICLPSTFVKINRNFVKIFFVHWFIWKYDCHKFVSFRLRYFKDNIGYCLLSQSKDDFQHIVSRFPHFRTPSPVHLIYHGHAADPSCCGTMTYYKTSLLQMAVFYSYMNIEISWEYYKVT